MSMHFAFAEGSAEQASPALLRLAMLGMIPGNGHPFSWSAIINGYEPIHLSACPYPVIIDYLSKNPNVGIPGVSVTHVWTDSPQEARQVARLARIPHVVAQPEEVIGQVDAVIIAVDDGDDHVRRARPFIEAGLPLLIDKPLATNIEDLRTFRRWHHEGAKIFSASGLRYASELEDLQGREWDWISAVTCNSWERYGIHILEPVYTLMKGGFVGVRSFDSGPDQFVHLRHHTGRVATLSVLREARKSFGVFHAYGAEGHCSFQFSDTYGAFRRQLLAFIDFAHSGAEPHPFQETIELMVILLAAQASQKQGGKEILLQEFQQSLNL